MGEETPAGLVEFLRARLDEDEQTARAAIGAGRRGEWEAIPIAEMGGRRALTCGSFIFTVMDPVPEGQACAEHAARHDPTRVLTEVAAKRAILAEHANGWPGTPWDAEEDENHDYCETCYKSHEPSPWPCPTLRLHAAVYADHPDYQQEWAT